MIRPLHRSDWQMRHGLCHSLNKVIRPDSFHAIFGTGKVSVLQIHAWPQVVLVCLRKCRLLNPVEFGKL
jgi:hypothetical protein